MNGNGRRIHERWKFEFPIHFAKSSSDDYLTAKARNISRAGMYIESEYDIEPSSDLYIWLAREDSNGFDKLPLYDFYRSRVRWLRPLEDGSGLGVGVRHVSKTSGVKNLRFQCHICEEDIPVGRVRFEKDFLYLCPNCKQDVDRYGEAGRAEILRMLEGNVF